MQFTSLTIASASGSAGGLTASRNRNGMYFRARAVPVQPNTALQQAVKAAFASLVSGWPAIAQTRREEWELYAENTPMVNRLGQSVLLTGMNMYVRGNVPRVIEGQAVIDVAPVVYGLPVVSPVTFSATAAGAALSIVFNDTDPWVSEDDAKMYLYVGRPVSPSVNFYKGPFRFTGTIDGASVLPPTTPAAAVSVNPLAVGQKVFLRSTVGRADARLSGDQITSALVA